MTHTSITRSMGQTDKTPRMTADRYREFHRKAVGFSKSDTPVTVALAEGSCGFKVPPGVANALLSSSRQFSLRRRNGELIFKEISDKPKEAR